MDVSKKVPASEVIVHPLVLLSVADHYNRVAKDARNKRVVGVLLGSRIGNSVDVCNSFAVPFEEDLTNPKVWFLDHNFLESMFWMFKKVNSRETVVGFYSTGPKIKENDIKICELLREFCPTHEPIFAIIDVRPETVGMPVTTYEPAEELTGDRKEPQTVFRNVACRIDAEEAEQVGVEHLLRDINDPSTSVLTFQIKQKLTGLSGLLNRLVEMSTYLQRVIAGQIPVNNQIIANMQSIFNLLPNLNIDEIVRSMLVNSNDVYLAIYVSSLVRSVIALHNLLANKLKYRHLDDYLENAASSVAGKTDAPTSVIADGKK